MLEKAIVVAGHIALDITPTFQTNRGESYQKLLKPGKLIQVGQAKISTGGAVSNTGLALHRLGAKVCLVSKVGNDQFGVILKNKIVDSGCPSRISVDENGATSYTIVLAPGDLDRIFLHDPGCNDTLCSADIDLGAMSQITHLHFGYPTLMKQFYLNEGEQLVDLFKKAKGLGLTTSLDLAAIDPETEAADCDWIKILTRVLPFVDFFVPSIEELGYMINRPLYNKWQMKSGDQDITKFLSIKDDLTILADQVLDMGTKVALLKCGVAGMFLKTASTQIMEEQLPELKRWGAVTLFEDSYIPDRLLSAKGAGDSSIGAFIKAVLDGYSPRECLQFAAATGASCVTEYDTHSGLLTFAEISEKISIGWKKQKYINP